MKKKDRCLVCARVNSLLRDDHIYLCERHFSEKEKIGWELFAEKFDCVNLFCLSNDILILANRLRSKSEIKDANW